MRTAVGAEVWTFKLECEQDVGWDEMGWVIKGDEGRLGPLPPPPSPVPPPRTTWTRCLCKSRLSSLFHYIRQSR